MKSILALLILSWTFTSFAYIQPVRPDYRQTPGELCTTQHRDFKEHRYQEKIPYCKRRVSSGLKKQIYRNYGVPLKQKKQYTIDHLIPLSIGGSNSIHNLWPEPKSIKKLRQNLEYDIYLALRKGQITQKEAINIILDAKFNPPINNQHYRWAQ